MRKQLRPAEDLIEHLWVEATGVGILWARVKAGQYCRTGWSWNLDTMGEVMGAHGVCRLESSTKSYCAERNDHPQLGEKTKF